MIQKRILQIDGALLTPKELEKQLIIIGTSQNTTSKTDRNTYPISRLLENYRIIKETYILLNEHVKLGIAIHPAGEWILDNFYIVEETVKLIKQELTRKKYRNFVALSDGINKGFARVYVLAAEIINHLDNKIDTENLEKYLAAYQTKKALNMDEIWNIGIFLQIAIIENIRKICKKIYISQIQKYKVESIIERLIDKELSNKFMNNRRIENFSNTKYPFVEYMSYRLKMFGKKTKKHLEILEEEVEKTGTTVSDIIKKEHFDIAIQKVSIGNCITSIKKIQRINFLEIFERINEVEELLKLDPAGVYDKMDHKSKDYYRQKIKEIAKSTKLSELYIAKNLLELGNEGIGKKKHIGYYLFGKNQNILYKKLGSKIRNKMNEGQKAKYYISIISVLTLIFTLIIASNFINKIPAIFVALGAIFLFIPVSETVIQIMQYVLSKIIKPKIIPKIDFSNGIDEANATMVVIPTILKSKEKVKEIMRKLEVFYLANKSDNLYFCLLGDCSESTRKVEEFDEEVINEGYKQVEILNKKYNNKLLFNFLYRKRLWNEKQNSYLGWERKRGALTEFVELLLGNISKNEFEKKYWVIDKNLVDYDNKQYSDFSNFLASNFAFPVPIKYIITLDSDTDLILNSATELVGAMAHILNEPEIEKGTVISGYGLIQPRVGLNIDVSYTNMFTKIFAGSSGIDSYTNAISDIYQDNFGEGIFTGKGIFNIDVYSKVLRGEIPENIVLSHDLLEGSYLRCGLASDILLMDGYPTKYMSFMTRLSRWIRGDWQILGWLKNKKLNILSKFKIFDNLRRSLFEVAVFICGLFFLGIGWIFNVKVYGLIVFLMLAIIFPFLLEILDIIIFKKEGEQKQQLFVPKVSGFIGAIYRGILTLGAFPFKAYISIKSIITSIYRMMYSKKKLLEWITSEEAEKNAKTDMFSYYKSMYINWVLGGIVLSASIFSGNIWWLLMGCLWIVTPWLMCDISTEKKIMKKTLNKEQKEYILEVAQKTFNFFKDNINENNNYLIPDNYQEDRKQKYVNRTSSTNIGLSILAIISGIDLGFISYKNGLEIIEKIIETIESLEKWNGHLFNWYNIETKVPLMPRYISTVDSGNFVGYLYVLKAFLQEEYEEQHTNTDLFSKKIELVSRVSKLIDDTDFSKLYSKQNMLFSIGFNIEEGKLTDSYYDLLASEARQASIVAIAKKDVPSKHWNHLSRTLTVLNNKKGLVSWAGTAFEYLMPNINIPRYEGTILDESNKFAIMSQMLYAKKLNIPWGISEAAFNMKDLHGNYQYKAFGIPWLGLKRGLADEMVVASYGSILSITDKPIAVYRNLKLLERYGMYDKYGFYESIDFTLQRLKRGENMAVVATYMAHHQALSLLSITNFIKNNIFQKRFMQNPEIEAVSILLQERMPETFIITKEEKEKPSKLKYQDYENNAEVTYNKIDNELIRSNLISNENYSVIINQKGEGYSKYKDILINRFKYTDEQFQGIFYYIKNIKNKEIWWNGSENTISTFSPDQSKFERIDGNIKTKLKITVDSDEPIEIRRLELENLGNVEETLEVYFTLEPVLSSKEQDYAHPSFNNLFLKFDYDYENNILECKRRKRILNEREIYLEARFSTEADVIVDNEFEISIEKINERGNFDIPIAIQNSIPSLNKVGLATNPFISMKKTIRIHPGEKVALDFVISVNEDRDVALQNLNKYFNVENIRRAYDISRARLDAEDRYLNLKGKEIILYQKILGYLIYNNPICKKNVQYMDNNRYSQKDLWKFGISGDIPIFLVKIKDINDVYLVSQILKMYEFFKTKNVMVDIVFLDEEKYSYENLIKDEIEAKIADKHLEYMKNIKGGIFVLSESEIKNEDVKLLEFVSAFTIDAYKNDLEHFIDDLEEEYLSHRKIVENRSFEKIYETTKDEPEDILDNKDELKYYNEYGAFSPDGKEYLICQNKFNRTPTVWSNILANEKFGTVVTENMGGYTWYKNSRLNRITSWYNNAFADIPSEVIYMQDEDNGKTWSLGQNPMPDEQNYNVVHGFGYTKYIHRSNNVRQELEVFVPNEDSVKINILKLNNKSLSRKKLRIVYFVKAVLGEDETKSSKFIKVDFDGNSNILQAQNLYENEFKTIAYLSSSEKIKSFTGDKSSFFGKGGISNPDGMQKYKLDGDNGIGNKSCMAIEIEVELESLSSKEIVLNLGAEDNIVDVKNMAYKYSKIVNCKKELEIVKKKWREILEKIQVYTPFESVNIMLNGWTLYQTISSRLLAKTGFYQSGGALGFRDQLQDTLALKYVQPQMIKEQILKHSRHQFIEGDVEHWWHEETSRGIRTKFSDDLVWLVFMVEEYIDVTGDFSILELETPYIKGDPLRELQDENYDLFVESEVKEPIFKHCVRALDKALNFGEHGLPKIGTGDWNDGFNTVGNKGKGESVWLGFFLYIVLKKFIPLCKYYEAREENNLINVANFELDVKNEDLKTEYKNDEKKKMVNVGNWITEFSKLDEACDIEIEDNIKLRSVRYQEIMDTLQKNLNIHGWDGRWFKRAYTDEGEVLGSIENEECRIDSIAQSWSVISGAGDNDKKFISMYSLENHLIDSENGIIKLLDPPFENGKLKPGYIKAYLPGVRENGGQYTHVCCC